MRRSWSSRCRRFCPRIIKRPHQHEEHQASKGSLEQRAFRDERTRPTLRFVGGFDRRIGIHGHDHDHDRVHWVLHTRFRRRNVELMRTDLFRSARKRHGLEFPLDWVKVRKCSEDSLVMLEVASNDTTAAKANSLDVEMPHVN